MKKIILLTLASLLSIWAAVAGPIDSERASLIATRLFEQMEKPSPLKKNITSKGEIRLTHTVMMDADIQAAGFGSMGESLTPCFYVFNRGDNAGFALVAGDDLVPEILAYSDRGQIDMEQLPDNLAFFLRLYQHEIQTIIASGIDVSTFSSFEYPDLPEAVLPLMETGPWEGKAIRWNQLAPYNMQLPEGAIYTGCVATAVAQLMRYYTWPEKGQGKNEYTDYYGNEYSVELGQTYDWENMPGTVDEKNAPKEQRLALSALMRDVGLSINTSYSNRGSYAYTPPVIRALRNNFFYKKSIKMLDRHTTTAYEWQKIVRTELSKKRPLYYAGADRTSGHAFICDGYKADGTYHFNWGWSGLSNGYFRLTLLAPLQLGAGAGNGTFTILQEIIVGLEPDKDGADDKFGDCDFRLNDMHKVRDAGQKIEGEARITCINEFKPNFLFGVRITDSEGKSTDLQAYEKELTVNYKYSISIPYKFDTELLKPGTNKVTFITKRTDVPGADWIPLLSYADIPHPYYYIDKADKLNIRVVGARQFDVKIEKVESDLRSYGPSTIDVFFTNSGIDEQRELLFLKLTPKGENQALKPFSFRGQLAEIAPNGASSVLHLEVKELEVLAGTYTLLGRFDREYDWQELGEVEVRNYWDEYISNPKSREQMLAYPNPTTGQVILRNPGVDMVDYALYTMDGCLLRRGLLQTTEQIVDFSELPVAVYLLRIGQEQTKLVKKD